MSDYRDTVENDNADEVNGIEGQLIYPDREVDAARAGEFAAGKVDTLYEDEAADDEARGWHNPADNLNAEERENEETESEELRNER
jgi:hypothetical protein